jgi:hypothetical protein
MTNATVGGRRGLLGACDKCNFSLCQGGCKCDNNCNCLSSANSGERRGGVHGALPSADRTLCRG